MNQEVGLQWSRFASDHLRHLSLPSQSQPGLHQHTFGELVPATVPSAVRLRRHREIGMGMKKRGGERDMGQLLMTQVHISLGAGAWLLACLLQIYFRCFLIRHPTELQGQLSLRLIFIARKKVGFKFSVVTKNICDPASIAKIKKKYLKGGNERSK